MLESEADAARNAPRNALCRERGVEAGGGERGGERGEFRLFGLHPSQMGQHVAIGMATEHSHTTTRFND